MNTAEINKKLDKYGLKVGDSVIYTSAKGKSTTCQVIGISDYFGNQRIIVRSPERIRTEPRHSLPHRNSAWQHVSRSKLVNKNTDPKYIVNPIFLKKAEESEMTTLEKANEALKEFGLKVNDIVYLQVGNKGSRTISIGWDKDIKNGLDDNVVLRPFKVQGARKHLGKFLPVIGTRENNAGWAKKDISEEMHLVEDKDSKYYLFINPKSFLLQKEGEEFMARQQTPEEKEIKAKLLQNSLSLGQKVYLEKKDSFNPTRNAVVWNRHTQLSGNISRDKVVEGEVVGVDRDNVILRFEKETGPSWHPYANEDIKISKDYLDPQGNYLCVSAPSIIFDSQIDMSSIGLNRIEPTVKVRKTSPAKVILDQKNPKVGGACKVLSDEFGQFSGLSHLGTSSGEIFFREAIITAYDQDCDLVSVSFADKPTIAFYSAGASTIFSPQASLPLEAISRNREVSKIRDLKLASSPTISEPIPETIREIKSPISLLERTKNEAIDAGYRIAANQLTIITQQILVSVLEKRGMEAGKLQAFAKMLETEVGKSFIGGVVGMTITYSSLYNDPRFQKLADEFRISAVAGIGNLVVEEAAAFLLPELSAIFSSLPVERLEDNIAISSSTVLSKEDFEEETPEIKALQA